MPCVTVDVDLSEFSDEELREELADRGSADRYIGGQTFFDRANQLLRLRKNDEALELLRTEVEERLGCIVP
jgi:hypothetical protein